MKLFSRQKTSALPIVAGMATMPTRLESLQQSLPNILAQVDKLFLFLDKFDEVPDFIQHPKITQLRSQEIGDLRANGKLLGLNYVEESSYYFCFDDDIIYPQDYVLRMTNQLRRMSVPAVIGVHASILSDHFESYVKDRQVIARSRPLWRNRRVDVLGTDSVAFRTQDLKFNVMEWTKTNMVDLHFALECAKRGLPRVSVRRKKRWLQAIEKDQADSIFRSLKGDDSYQTSLAIQLIASRERSL